MLADLSVDANVASAGPEDLKCSGLRQLLRIFTSCCAYRGLDCARKRCFQTYWLEECLDQRLSLSDFKPKLLRRRHLLCNGEYGCHIFDSLNASTTLAMNSPVDVDLPASCRVCKSRCSRSRSIIFSALKPVSAKS